MNVNTGKVKEGRKFRSSRGDWREKVTWRTEDSQ